MFTLLTVILVLAIGAYFISKQPDEFRITRSAMLQASPTTIFPYINNLRLWNAWSPWARLDPDCQNSFEGPESGAGATMRWSGNKKVGKGAMTILESAPDSRISMRLDFLEPFKATNQAEFTFTPQETGTLVIWNMNGRNQFIGKLMGVIFNCEKMVGKQFDQGLENLCEIVEPKA